MEVIFMCVFCVQFYVNKFDNFNNNKEIGNLIQL